MTDEEAMWTEKMLERHWQEGGGSNGAVLESFQCGAAVAFGLMGMAEAIRQRERERPNRELAAWYADHIASLAGLDSGQAMLMKVFPEVGKSTEMPAAAKLEWVMELAAPMTEQEDGTFQRDPGNGIIALDDALRLLEGK